MTFDPERVTTADLLKLLGVTVNDTPFSTPVREESFPIGASSSIGHLYGDWTQVPSSYLSHLFVQNAQNKPLSGREVGPMPRWTNLSPRPVHEFTDAYRRVAERPPIAGGYR